VRERASAMSLKEIVKESITDAEERMRQETVKVKCKTCGRYGTTTLWDMSRGTILCKCGGIMEPVQETKEVK
jgi:Zn finger protein HypA/HybF involved in hydrogenase expression